MAVITLNKYCEITGESELSIFERVKEGIWIIGMQVIRINDEHVPYWIDLAKVEEWVNLGGNRLAS